MRSMEPPQTSSSAKSLQLYHFKIWVYLTSRTAICLSSLTRNQFIILLGEWSLKRTSWIRKRCNRFVRPKSSSVFVQSGFQSWWQPETIESRIFGFTITCSSQRWKPTGSHFWKLKTIWRTFRWSVFHCTGSFLQLFVNTVQQTFYRKAFVCSQGTFQFKVIPF